jgi:hypothetical protein
LVAVTNSKVLGLFRRRELVSKKLLIGIVMTALVLMAAACSSATDSNTNANAADTATTTTAPDNSEVTTTTDQNGVKTETRTFKNNPRVSKVVVTTRNGVRTAKVYSPSGEEKDIATADDPNVLEATGDKIADAAGWVKDKSVTAAEKTKEGAVTVKDATVDTSKKVADKTVDVGKDVVDKSKPIVKKVGNKSVDIGTTVVDATKTGAKKTGRAIKKVINP